MKISEILSEISSFDDDKCNFVQGHASEDRIYPKFLRERTMPKAVPIYVVLELQKEAQRKKEK